MTPARLEIAIAASTLVSDAAAARVSSALADAGVATILLKGASTVRALYPHGGARAYVDADLLVEPLAFERAETLVAELGYRRVPLPRLDGVAHHADTWQHRESRALVDLHRTIPFVGASRETLWRVLAEHTEPIDVGGALVRALAPPALALHLALHAASHGPSDEHPLRDLELAVVRWDDGVWQKAHELATRLEAVPGLRAGLTLVPSGRKLAETLRLPPDLPPELALVVGGRRGAIALHSLTRTRRGRERLRFVARQVFPPREYMRLWSTPSRRAGLRLAVAYPHRWAVVAARTPAAVAAVRQEHRPHEDGRPILAARRADPFLAVSGLSRSFGPRVVVSRLDLSLDPGERVALRGPNGSGKTTAIRCIAGSLTPSQGTVIVGGESAGSLGARRLIGLSLAQERSFYMRLTGRDNLLFFARVRFPSERDARRAVDLLAEELELRDIVATRADACSAGMLQQLAFARALLGEPPLLLLDEPTRSLDGDAASRLWAAVERRTDTAVVIATHTASDLDRCDTVVDFPT